ncbi:MAG: hypothetical protein QOF35_2087 [Actinomycetota bacterium]|nr:hypothetical protein [Actinomycetota bacterium]
MRLTGGRDGRRHVGKTLWALLLTAAIFASPMAITLQMKHESERGVEAEEQLLHAVTELRIQAGIEERVISGRTSVRNAHTQLVASRKRGRDRLTEAEGLGLPSDETAQIVEVTRHYSQSVDDELRLFSLGQKEAAFTFDGAQVEPRFAAVLSAVEQQEKQLERRAGRAQRYGDVGVLLSVLLSLILVSVVQSRRRWAEVRSQAKQQSDAH